MPPFGVIIPARLSSTRLPGKVLIDIHGRPIIQWVVENAKRSGADFVWVATDDEQVVRAVSAFGGEAIMTSSEHRSGTDRLAEVVLQRNLPSETIIVNIQGDEPLLAPPLAKLVADALATSPDAGVSTLATPIVSMRELFNPHVVKVVTDSRGRALTFSRAPIPWVRGVFSKAGPHSSDSSSAQELPEKVPFLRHIGLYAYRVAALTRLSHLAPPPEEIAESLEQLRALHYGLPILVKIQQEAPPHGVDTEEDLKAMRELASSRFAQ